MRQKPQQLNKRSLATILACLLLDETCAYYAMEVDYRNTDDALATCTQEATGVGSIQAFYDPSTELVNMVATLNHGTSAGWGWGESTTDSEMVIFKANGDQSAISFVYGQEPGFAECYDSQFVVHVDDKVIFTAKRPLQCDGISDPKGNSFKVLLDTEMQLYMAWNPDSSELSLDKAKQKQFTQMLESGGTCVSTTSPELPPKKIEETKLYLAHGVFMWLTWAVIGLLQIFTNRYWSHKWRWARMTHMILGFFSGVLIIVAGAIALKVKGEMKMGNSWHSKSGYVIFWMGLGLLVTAIVGNLIRLKLSLPWNTRGALLVSKAHRWLGRLIIIGSQFANGTGWYHFYKHHRDSPKVGLIVAGSTTGLFFLILIIGEINYQIKLRKNVVYTKPEATMNAREFEQAIKNGRKLCILDDLVLDMEEFIEQHPGGRFVLTHNIGRDISKFFYGGYSLEDNLGSAPAQGYNHTTYAKLIVSDIAIAVYEPETEVSTVECQVREDLCESVNFTTKTIVFESLDQSDQVNWKSYFKDISYIGKHFLVRNLDGGSSIARHYTICNAIRPEVYNRYINSLREESDPEYQTMDHKTELDGEDSNQMTFCIKNYQNPRGLSTMIFNATNRFEVKGPMGLGLLPKAKGHHMVFAAGTGVLCFIDLVAELCRLNTGRHSVDGSVISVSKANQEVLAIDPEHFQLHLYVSYQSRSQSVGLELFEALEAYCRRTNTNNFHLHLRLSQEQVNQGRWDAQFIRQEIGKFGTKNVQKVWVCGPPIMNETFDRVLSGYDNGQQGEADGGAAVGEENHLLQQGANNFRLSPEQYEIL